MGDPTPYQPLTTWDRLTVVIYRTGIVLSTAWVCLLAFVGSRWPDGTAAGMQPATAASALLYLLTVTVGLSVVFIHLYVSRFHRFLKGLYVMALVGVAVLAVIGKGAPVSAVANEWYGPLLLLPLAGCLGFVTAKEAFCFRLSEGYLLALLMPFLLFLASTGALRGSTASGSVILVAALLVLFTFRKVFQPLHYDIGDKSAYQ